MSRIVPIADAPDAAIALAARGIAREAPTPMLPEVTPPDPHEAARTALARTLGHDERAPGWVMLDADGEPRAMLAAFLELVDVTHPSYTYMPARFAVVPLSLWHVTTRADLDAIAPLVDQLANSAADLDIDRLQVQTRPHDWIGSSAWRDLGLRSDVVMAGRRTSPIAPGRARADIRVATTEDVASLVALAMEEHDYHAHNTRTGTRANQVAEPTLREVRRSLQQEDLPGILVACEPDTGDVLSMISLSTIDLPPGVASAGFTPSRCGYIGLPSTTARARGRGLGRSRVARALDELAARRLDTVMLHYFDDNPLSRSFWNGLGFSPHLVTLSGEILAARRADN